MTVKHILDDKGRDVFTMRPTETLAEAAGALAERRIGAVVIIGEDGGIAGILSERDIVRMVGIKGADCLGASVADAMTRDVVTCHEEMTVHELMEIMTHRRFRHVPVIEEGRLVGLVSIGDVVKRRIEDVQREADEMRSYIAAAG